MKNIIIIGDGMADWPMDELKGKTLLEHCHTPNMDFIAKNGCGGLVHTIPKNYEPGSDVANLSAMGYNPEEFYTGRAPLEAISLNIPLKKNDVAFRCNLVTIEGDILKDYCSGHITSNESAQVVSLLQKKLNTTDIEFFAGTSYRHIMVYRNAPKEWHEGLLHTIPPHDFTGLEYKSKLPKGPQSDIVNAIMEKSFNVLKNAPVTLERINLGKNPANMIWLWGQGGAVQFPSFKEKWNLTGSVISAVDLIQGIGKGAGLTVEKVKGATGFIDTNYKGKVDKTLEVLKTKDFVYLHVEAPDEAGHSGKLEIKKQAIEDFDKKIVGPVLEGLKQFNSYRVLLMPDHATPIKIKTHTREPVPFAIYPPIQNNVDLMTCYTEEEAKKGTYTITEGYKLFNLFVS